MQIRLCAQTCTRNCYALKNLKGASLLKFKLYLTSHFSWQAGLMCWERPVLVLQGKFPAALPSQELVDWSLYFFAV